MSEEYTTKRLLALRRVTRAASEMISTQVEDYLQTLNHGFRPRSVLGEYISSPTKETIRNADAAFSEFKALYESVSNAKPFLLRKELTTPLINVSPEAKITAWDYIHNAKSDQGDKPITVTSPLKWVLHYAPFPPQRLKELISHRDQSISDLQQAVIHYLILQVMLARQPGITRMFAALRMPISFQKLPFSGELPVAVITSEVRTVLPPDPVLVESTEISGRDAFEEVVDIAYLRELQDPLTAGLQELLDKEAALKAE